VVDDEPQIIRLCKRALTQQGYQVQTADSGRQALAYLESEPFDLLVVDIKMPDMDGLTVLRRGRDLDPNLTAIVITGYASIGKAIEALNAGARGFILKPFGVRAFSSAVQKAMAQLQKEQERLLLRAQLPIMAISQALMTEGNVGELARQLLEEVMQQTGAERAWLALLDENAGELDIAATMGGPDEALERMRIPANDKIVAQALQMDEPWVLDAQVQTNLSPPLRLLIVEPNTVISVLVPLRTREKKVGLLGLSRKKQTDTYSEIVFRQSDLNLLSIVGKQIAIALENARLYVTEQQRTAELAHALEQRQELDRLKNEFIRNVSHELRTPTSLILGYAELLTSGAMGEVQADQQELLTIILQRTLVLRDLVENITTISENETRELKQEPIFLVHLVDTALRGAQARADQSGLELRRIVEPQVPPVLGDASYLSRMIEHLLDNALKFTPEGGTITVSLHSVDEQVMLQVADTGIGIAAEHHERIFDRFYQVNGTLSRPHEGSGLGLALVKEIVESHRGTVAVESQLEQGCTFTVRLPAATAVDQVPNGDHTITD
jgi:signal transduction histidine kinase